jgi:hypothetical protein
VSAREVSNVSKLSEPRSSNLKPDASTSAARPFQFNHQRASRYARVPTQRPASCIPRFRQVATRDCPVCGPRGRRGNSLTCIAVGRAPVSGATAGQCRIMEEQGSPWHGKPVQRRLEEWCASPTAQSATVAGFFSCEASPMGPHRPRQSDTPFGMHSPGGSAIKYARSVPALFKYHHQPGRSRPDAGS